MTDITELAQRLKLEVHRAVSNFNPQMNIKTRDLKELVEALEKAQKLATQQGNIACALFDEVTAQRKRIAELESHTVTVKLPRPGFITVAGERSGVYPKDEVEAALTSQGIKWEAE
ncbi:TPA: hypothetical protein ACNGYW_002763 [Klebsiella michiganensis]|uniref:Ead/Ea22-like family protein n=1 Tax=Klebsiella michiganensis TaxID=1134687 RepID=A0A2J4Z0U2_9ENTR|nr:hypothetical protein CWM85_20720 [Klebsiella michiganensis]